jgi:DNA-binding MarR family transcriptional regulator
MAAITGVLRVQRLYQARVDRTLKALKLNSSRYEVVMLLYFARERSLPLGVISDRLQLNAATITNLVDRLVRVGYVKRMANPRDKRGKLAVLTDAGNEVAVTATEIMNHEVFGTLGLSTQEAAELNQLLWKLRSYIA